MVAPAADPMAQTAISSGVPDQVVLEGTGSGSGLLDLTRDISCFVDIVHFELDYGDLISQPEQPLRITQANEPPRIVVIKEPGIKNPGHPEPRVFGNHAKRREFTLRTRHLHNRANRRT